MEDLIHELTSYEYQVHSIFSHLAASDDPEKDEFTRSQFDTFDEGYERIADCLGYRPHRHILNSVGILRHPDYAYEMVRLGKGIYGIDLPEQYQHLFERVHTLKAKISQIKTIAPRIHSRIQCY